MSTNAPKKRGCFGRLIVWTLYLFGGLLVLSIIGAVIQGLGEAAGVIPTRAPTPTPTITLTPSVTPIPSDTPIPTNTPLPTDAPVPTPPPAVGVDVLVGEVRWKIISVENLGNTVKSSNTFIEDLTTSGMFIKIHLEVENRSKDMLTYAGLDLVDSQGREYTSSSDAIMLIDNNETCVFENLNPNIVKVCTHIYEVPIDATGLKAKTGDLEIFGAEEAVIDLGL